MSSRFIEVEYNGTKYPNLKEFCRECNLDYKLISGRVFRGWSLEDAINKPRMYNNKAKEFSYNGKKYSSISSFCKEYGLNYHTVMGRLDMGWSIEDAVSKSRKENGKPFSYNDKKYKSIYAYCKENSLNYQSVQSRLKRGWSLEDAISKPKKTTRTRNIISYMGKEYDSVRALCKEHDLDYDLVISRLRYGWSLEDVLNRKKSEHDVLYDGKLYKSGAELAREHGISITAFKNRLHRGYSIEESIVISDIKLKKQSDSFYECKCRHCGLKFLGTLEIAKKHTREHKEDYENMILGS